MIPESAPGARDRRTVLRAGLLTLAGAPAASAVLAACGTGYATDPDPLLPLLDAARGDAAAAAALSGSAGSAAARAVARVRSRHAEVLRAEIERLNRPRPDNRDAPAPRVSDLADLATRLADARRAAVSLVPSLPTYRAGLVGSVAAGCAGLAQLAPELESNGAADPPGISVRADSIDDLDSDAISALRTALSAEYAAVWIYGLVTAFLPADFTGAVQRAQAAHRETADATRRMLAAVGAEPQSPQAAYVPAEPVTDESSAIRVVVTAEEDTARSWRGTLVRTNDTAVRNAATRALVGAAARATSWRAEAGTEPAAVALPGKP